MKTNKEYKILALGGIVIAIIAFALPLLGNPKNMGFCIACFVRDIAGGLKLHSAGVVQYIRPEIIGLVLGSFILSLFRGEFKPRGGSSPLLRFVIAVFVMIGALAFLGCPFRMIIRLSAGDLNALVGLFGFISGVALGALFLTKGFSLGRYQKQSATEGVAISAINILLLILLLTAPFLFAFSEKGPGSMHAPIFISLLAGLIVGAISQRTRLCMVGGIRDTIIVKDKTLLFGFVSIFTIMLILNLVSGSFKLSFSGQPVAHSDHLFNFLGMCLCGLGSVMLGGCPLRQLILAGEGNTDSAISVVGLLVGAAISHNFSLAGVANEGVKTNGRVAVIFGLLLLIAIALIKIYNVKKEEK